MKDTKKLASWPGIAILAAMLCLFLPAGSIADTLVVAVRHAEKQDVPEDPELSETGRIRAEALARILADLDIDAIYATPFQRTRQTAEPLRKLSGLELRIAPTENHAELMASRIREDHENEVVVVVGHSNTTPALAAALGIADPPEIHHTTYDRLFLIRLSTDGAELLPLRYGEPAP